jgi:hypothetical protein
MNLPPTQYNPGKHQSLHCSWLLAYLPASGRGRRYLTNAICVHSICWHDATFPPPVSEFRAILLFVRSHVARGWKAPDILSVVHSACVPLLSLSKYLCTSKTRFVVEPSGLVTLSKAGPDPLEMKVPAEV